MDVRDGLHGRNGRTRRWHLLLALLATMGLIAASCGGDDGDDTSGADTTADTDADADQDGDADDGDAADGDADDGADADGDDADSEGSGEPFRVAYLSASSANTWLAASLAEMEKVAADNNIELVEFDAQFDAALQQSQFQDAIASNEYDGIILVAISGAAAIPDVEDALAAGLEVVFLNQVVGEDFTTAVPQVDGVAAAVFEPPQVRGERLGEITVATCEGIDPCNVVYFYGIRGIPLDEAIRAGWDSVVEGSTVNVVAEAEGQYLGPDVGLAAMQDILVSTSDFDVVLGPDQSMQGAEIALEDEGVEDVRIIGFGGSSYAVSAIGDGRWYSGLFGAPGTEGRLAMEAMVAALDGEDRGGVDPALSVPNNGLMFQDNIGDFTPEWDG